MRKVEVVAAIIINKGQILCVQRPKHKLLYISNKFEFPGGKIEEGEKAFRFEKANLTELIGRVTSVFQNSIANEGFSVTLSVPEALPEVQ